MAASRPEADAMLGPSVSDVSYVYGESGQSCIWIITYCFVYGTVYKDILHNSHLCEESWCNML